MLKPYTRNKRITDKILYKCNDEMYSNTLYTILKDKDTLYSIEEMKQISTYKYFLKKVTGVDNVCILVYYDVSNIVIIDKELGYTIDKENSLYGHLVGLDKYVLFGNGKGYIIKTNYNSIKELTTKFGIEVKNCLEDNYISNVEVALPYIHASTDDIWTISYPIYPVQE